MVALAFLFTAHQAQIIDPSKDPALAKPITFRAPAAASKKLMDALARASGLPLKASTSIENEILMVKVDKAPASEVMARLARAVAGSWVMVDGTYTLTRTEADEAARVHADYARTYEDVKKALDDERLTVQQQKPFDDAAAKALINKVKQERGGTTGSDSNPETARRFDYNVIQKELDSFPSGRLAARIFSLIKPEFVANSPGKRRTVYSTSPNQMELPLTLDMEEMVNQFVAEQNVWADALAGMDEMERMQLFQMYGRNPNAVNRITTPPSKVNLIVERYDNNGGDTNLIIEVLGPNGSVLGSSELHVATGVNRKPFPNIKQDKEGQPIQFSPAEMEMLDAISAMTGQKGSESKPISPDLRSKLSRPDTNEVLASFPSDILLQTGDNLGRNVVADMPDALLILGAAALQGGKPTANTVLQLLQSLSDVLAPVLVDDKYLEIDGGVPLSTTFLAHRSDRPELAHLLSSGTDALSLEALARYETIGHGTLDDYVEILIGSALYPGFISSAGNERSFYALKLLGTLMEANDLATVPTATVPFRSLDAGTLECLKDIVFYQQPQLIRPPQAVASGFQPQVTSDPCELFPNGLPVNGSLSVSITSKSAVFSADGQGRVIEPNQYAWEQETKLHPEVVHGTTSGVPVTTRFKSGTTRKLTITIHLGGNASQELSCSENHMSSDQVLSYDQLPDDFKKAVKQQLDNYDQMFNHK